MASSPEPIEAFCLDSRCQRQTLWAGFWAMHGSFSGNASAAQGLVLLVEVLLDLTHRFLGNLGISRRAPSSCAFRAAGGPPEDARR